MILLARQFVTSYGTILVGMMRSNYSFKFPCSFDLFNGSRKVATVIATSLVMDNNSVVMTMKGTMDYDYSRISLTLEMPVEVSLIDGRCDAYLLQNDWK